MACVKAKKHLAKSFTSLLSFSDTEVMISWLSTNGVFTTACVTKSHTLFLRAEGSSPSGPDSLLRAFYEHATSHPAQWGKRTSGTNLDLN